MVHKKPIFLSTPDSKGLINSGNSISFVLPHPATKSKSKVTLLKAPADTVTGALPVVSSVLPLATDWSPDWELPMLTVGN